MLFPDAHRLWTGCVTIAKSDCLIWTKTAIDKDGPIAYYGTKMLHAPYIPHAARSELPLSSPPIGSSSTPAITTTSRPGFSTRNHQSHVSCPSIAGAWGTITTMAWMHLISINSKAELLWYSQDHSILAERWSSIGSGLENKETRASRNSPPLTWSIVKNLTSAMCILFPRRT